MIGGKIGPVAPSVDLLPSASLRARAYGKKSSYRSRSHKEDFLVTDHTQSILEEGTSSVAKADT